jgi:hypothetical protein
MMDAGVAAFWARGGNGIASATGMTTELVFIGVEDEWQETFLAESLPAALVADSERSGAATVMKDKALLVVVEGLLDRGNKFIANDATAGKAGAIFKIDNRDRSGFVAFDGELVKRDDCIMLAADIIISNQRGGGTKDSLAHLASESESRVLRILILMIGGLVRLVDNNETKVSDGSKEGAAWADYDLRGGRLEGFLPELMADRFGLFGVEQNYIFEEVLKILDKLGGEGDFWDEQNDGFARGKLTLSELDIDISFSGASNTMQENSICGIGLYFVNDALLGGGKRVLALW